MCPKKVGRPIEQNPHNHRIEVRLTEQQYQTLVECCEMANINKSAVIVKGIEMFRRSL